MVLRCLLFVFYSSEYYRFTPRLFSAIFGQKLAKFRTISVINRPLN